VNVHVKTEAERLPKEQFGDLYKMGKNGMVLQPPADLEARFESACAFESDIHQHLPLLRKLAERCAHVTEFGTRWANGSTVAFLAAQPKTFITWDLEPAHIVSNRVAELCNMRGRTNFQPRVGNTLEITIEPTDLLFIDTWHTAKQCLSELERHCVPAEGRVRKYLVFHDAETFGVVGEDKGQGIRAAIRQFQKFFAFPLWKLMDDSDELGMADPRRKHRAPQKLDLENNNGLVVLEHVCADGHSPEKLRGHCLWCGRKTE
jgi:hypothetical protein